VLGFERQLQGSPAGDRTLSLIGVETVVIGALSQAAAPNALAGAVTGIGFSGAGVVFRHNNGSGVVGRGRVAVVSTALVLLCLVIQHIPGLRLLDASRWQHRFRPDGPAAPDTDAPPTPGHS